MFRLLASCFAIMILQTACVTPGHIGPEGFEHDAMGYKLPLAKPDDKNFINDRWAPETKTHSHSVESKSTQGRVEHIRFKSFDLAWNHKDTKGVMAIQSFPLAESTAERKLAILAKDYADALSGGYFFSFGTGNFKSGVSRKYVTNIVESKEGKIGTAETYEVIVEVADSEQLKLNPQHRLQKYKMLLIRPKAENGWTASHWESTDPYKSSKAEVKDTYPALIVLTYAMDFAYYKDYLAEFDGLVSRLKLRD